MCENGKLKKGVFGLKSRQSDMDGSGVVCKRIYNVSFHVNRYVIVRRGACIAIVDDGDPVGSPLFLRKR